MPTKKYKSQLEVRRAVRLREARKRHFKSIVAAAEAHGWSSATLNAHEQGERAFKYERAEEYASAFNVDVGWLWKGAETTTESSGPTLVRSWNNLLVQEEELAGHLQRAIELATRLRETTRILTDLVLWDD